MLGDLEDAVDAADAYADRDRRGVRSSELASAITEHQQALIDAEKERDDAVGAAEEAEEERLAAVRDRNEAQEERDEAFECRNRAQAELEAMRREVEDIAEPETPLALLALADLVRAAAPRILVACSSPPRPRHCDACHASHLAESLAVLLAKIADPPTVNRFTVGESEPLIPAPKRP